MSDIKLFESKKVRTLWDEERELWYFSIIDVIEVLTGTDRPRKYWSDLKAKLTIEGSQLSENIGQLKMAAEDGKMRLTDVADTEQLLRLIQSIPSPKAEPFKQWLAKVGYERLEETENPELSFDRAMETYLAKGYSKAVQKTQETKKRKPPRSHDQLGIGFEHAGRSNHFRDFKRNQRLWTKVK